MLKRIAQWLTYKEPYRSPWETDLPPEVLWRRLRIAIVVLGALGIAVRLLGVV